MADRVVIMSRGRIEQIGNPQEIYRAPRSRFVAEFLGSSNIFSGSVSEANGQSVRIATPAGEFVVLPSAARPLARGDKATFVVSDDRVQLGNQAPADGFNGLQATVVGEEFVGATAVIHLEGAGGIEIKAQKSHDELGELDLEPDAKVWVSWRAEAAHILPGE
jgi:spermidine/putrescine transport system ATP-binding protein